MPREDGEIRSNQLPVNIKALWTTAGDSTENTLKIIRKKELGVRGAGLRWSSESPFQARMRPIC